MARTYEMEPIYESGRGRNKNEGQHQDTLQQILELLKNQQQKGPTGDVPRGARPRGPPQCYYCNKPGHFIRECHQRRAEQQNSGGALSGPRQPQRSRQYEPNSDQGLFNSFKRFMDQEKARATVGEEVKD